MDSFNTTGCNIDWYTYIKFDNASMLQNITHKNKMYENTHSFGQICTYGCQNTSVKNKTKMSPPVKLTF